MINLKSSIQKKWLLILTTSLCLIAISYLLNQKIIEQNQIKELANKLLQQQPEQQIQKEKQAPNTTEINLSSIELPAPPKIKRGLKRGRSQLNQNKPNKIANTKNQNTQNKSTKAIKHQDTKNDKPVTDQQAIKNYQDVLAGKGPSIEVAWPNLVSEREMLFQLLTQCTGMRLGTLNNGDINLIANSHVKNVKLSDFVRIINGKMTKSEKYQFSNTQSGTPVRLFPLSIDINLIKKLSETKAYYKSKSITGQYQVALGNIWLKDITYDGSKAKGPRLLWQNDC
ncbi:hypothetical protein KO527_09950 [Pseudoalteromonas sp. C2R02]|uniref:hypothetical protein n=1 Tax=Pseudoalteromonas sp. C2R02 TaxID=2841565 RepID=UPI001C0861B7|nr:hypothetical protein [Pseudoalteromonas sp. C2R02]MBU2969668.1 hypothetical protein [Pseudoalteromonas sp. C2R02]